MFEGFLGGVHLIATPYGIMIMVLSIVVGISVAIIPGIGPSQAMALLLPFTFAMEPQYALLFLVGIFACSGFAGSITAILLNVPGDATNAASALDGYPLSQQGRAGEAIGAKATASALGALFGAIILIASIPFLRSVVLSFGYPEFFALAMAGIAMISAFAARDPVKGLISGLLGMALSMVGTSTVFPGDRFSFGLWWLSDGIPLIPVVMGLFAVPAAIDLLRENRPISATGTVISGGIGKGIMAALQSPVCLLRSSSIGTLIGMLPGVGGSVAPWMAYYAEVSLSKDKKSFGRGNIRGVIAPEASLDAKDGGALLTVLVLGIPATVTTALLLSAFVYHGITPGQRLLDKQMDLVWVMIIALLVANTATAIIGVASARWLIKLTVVPATIIAPLVIVLTLVGAYASELGWLAVVFTLGVGFLAVAMAQFNIPRVPFLIGFILMPIAERNLHVSLQVSQGSYDFLLRPITLIVLIIAVTGMLAPWVMRLVRRRTSRRQPVAVGGPGDAAGDTDAVGSGAGDANDDGSSQEESIEPTLSGLALIILMLVATALFIVQAVGMSADRRFFPMIVFVPLAVLLIVEAVRVAVAWGGRRELIWQQRHTAVPLWWPLAWVLLLMAAMLLFGMVVGSGLFVAAFQLLYGRWWAGRVERVPMAIVTGVLTSVSIYLLFTLALDIRLPEGLIALPLGI